jgi:hypothetical protein
MIAKCRALGYWIHELNVNYRRLRLGFGGGDNLDRTSELGLFTGVIDAVVRRFDGVKSFFIRSVKQHTFTVLFGHLKLFRCHFHTVIATDALGPL